MPAEAGFGSVAAALRSPEAALVADDHGRYVAVNDAACRLLGYSRDELLGMNVWDLTPKPHELDGLVLWKEFIEVGVQAGVYWLLRRNASLVEVSYRAKANVEPGRHVSLLVPHDSVNTPFESPRSSRRHRTRRQPGA